MEVVFIFEGQSIKIQGNKDQKVKEICNRLSAKINININSLIFLYGGNQLNADKKLNEITKENKINILVYKNENEICPKCGNILNNKIIDEIILANNNINYSLTGMKIQIEHIMNDVMNKKDINYINSQLNNISLTINNINENIKKINNQINQIKYNPIKKDGYKTDLNLLEENINFKESTIIKEDEKNIIISEIENRMNKKIKQIKKLYQATKDGGDPEIFHLKCDEIPNTLVFVKSEGQRRFGGFTPIPWKSQG